MNELLLDAKILFKDEEMTLLPQGLFVWNKIIDFLKEKFSRVNYQEIYTSSLENFVKNSSEVPCEYYAIEHNKDEIKLISYGKYNNEIEEARNKTIDILEIYNQLGKELLAIPFLSGKDPLIQDNHLLTTYLAGKNIESNYLGQYKNSYLTYSKITSDILYTLLEIHRDEKGLVFPPKIAPIQFVIIPVKPNEKGVLKECRKVTEILKDSKYRSMLDERNISNVEKKNDAIKKGIPFIIEIGPRDLERNIIEVTFRDNLLLKEYSNESFVSEIDIFIKQMQKRMYLKVLEKNFDEEKKVFNFEELHNNINRINKIMWCGEKECLNHLVNTTNFISFNQQIFKESCIFCSKKAKHSISIIKK